jgi:hypothetical protein
MLNSDLVHALEKECFANVVLVEVKEPRGPIPEVEILPPTLIDIVNTISRDQWAINKICSYVSNSLPKSVQPDSRDYAEFSFRITSNVNTFLVADSTGEWNSLMYFFNYLYHVPSLGVLVYIQGFSNTLYLIIPGDKTVPLHFITSIMPECLKSEALRCELVCNATDYNFNSVMIYIPPITSSIGHYVLNSLGPRASVMKAAQYSRCCITLAVSPSNFLYENEIEYLTGGILSKNVKTLNVKNSIDARVIADKNNYAYIELLGSDVDDLQFSYSILNDTSQFNTSSWQVYKQITSIVEALDKKLVIGIGLKKGSGELINLEELISDLPAFVQELGVPKDCQVYLLDGLCRELLTSPENDVYGAGRLVLSEEHELALNITSQLRLQGCACVSMVGTTLFEQLMCLGYSDLILAYAGSAQAKYKWLLRKPVIQHNPKITKYFMTATHSYVNQVSGYLQFAFRSACASRGPSYFIPTKAFETLPASNEDSYRPNYLLANHFIARESIANALRNLGHV